MAVTRLGWDIITSSNDPRLVKSSWITGKVRGGDHKVILDYIASRWNAEVGKIIQSQSWGWANRSVRGESGIPSEHAAAIAQDHNASKYPLGVDASKLMTKAQIKAVRDIMIACGGAARWGGDYAGRPDVMHVELKGGNALVKKIADQIRNGTIPGAGGSTVPTGKPEPKPSTGKTYGNLSKSDTINVQRYLRSVEIYHGLIDGIYGDMLKAAVREFQLLANKYGGAKFSGDGLWGELTQRWFIWVRDVLQPAVGEWKASERLGPMLHDGNYGPLTAKHVAAVQGANPNLYKGVVDGKAQAMTCKLLKINPFKW